MKISIIEDSAVVAKFIAKYLANSEYQVKLYGSSIQEIERLIRDGSDLVICPGFPQYQKGPAIVSTLKFDTKFQKTTFVVSTSLEATDLQSEWDMESIDGILVKPFGREQLLGLLDQFKARHSALSRDIPLAVVVDDSTTVRSVLKAEMTSLGFEVMTAVNGREGLALIRETMPDLVLTDIEMPEKTGLELTSELTGDPKTSHIPVIVISTLINDERVRRWFKFGANLFLKKPVDSNELAQAVSSVMGQRHVSPQGSALVVDSNTISASIISKELIKIGVRANLCRNMNELDAFLAVCRPDLVILDIVLQDGNGIEACRRLRSRDDLATTNIIIITDENNRGAVVQGLNSGANDFLLKPFAHEEFRARIQNLLRTKRLHDDLAKRNRMLETLAYRDGLTGLLNRRYLDEALKRELERAKENYTSLGFIMIDLDHFKKVNDNFGHNVGDIILQEIATQIEQNVGNLGIACRYGGEEMCVFFPGVSLAKSKEIAEKIRLSCGERLFTEHKIRQTLSIGVSAFPKYSNSETLVADADQALYRAKSSGRNQVVSFEI